jgi:hypothetical protein
MRAFDVIARKLIGKRAAKERQAAGADIQRYLRSRRAEVVDGARLFKPATRRRIGGET